MGARTGVALAPAALAILIAQPAPAQAQTAGKLRQDLDAARAEIAAQKDQIARQEALLQAQEERLRRLEASLGQLAATTPAPTPAPVREKVERVGEAPEDFDRPIDVAVLGQQGSLITRAGQLTAELQLDYTRADRNRAVFRGIELVESVLVGVFDINESHQDMLSAAASLRYGVTDRFELGVKAPFVRRSDSAIIAPVQGSATDDAAATIDTSAKATGIGDLELTARYQLTRARRDGMFLIGNLQAVVPTGQGAFQVPRDSLGRALKAPTGSGFFAIAPSVTAIVPSDPLVLFGTLGYTFNLPRNVSTVIPPVVVDRVDPGNSISFGAGVGIAFNNRTSINFGYAHNWGFGTQTTTRLLDPGPNDPGPITRRSRDLQIGRFLFGVTHRLTDRFTINWSVEVGATDDAPDLRTSLRIPFVFSRGG